MELLKKTKPELIDHIKILQGRIADFHGLDVPSSLLENISSIVIVLDRGNKAKYVTPSVEWFLGYDIADLMSENFLEFIHAEDMEKIENLMNQIQKSPGSSLILPEFRIRHKRGAWIYIEGDISNQLEDESLQGIVLNLYDITQRKLFEMDYARLLGAVMISSDAFLLCDNDGNIIFINDATMNLFGLSDKSHIISRNINDFLKGFDHEKVYAKLQAGSGYIKSLEHEFIANGAVAIPVESSIAIMRDSEKKQMGLVFISRDITERKKVEGELNNYRNHLEELVDEQTKEVHATVKRLKKMLEGIVDSMAYVVESRDPYTAGHQKRVGDIAEHIAREMKLDEDRIEGIRLAGLVHDLGKVYVPAEILNKHGKLDEVEFMLIKKHPKVGYDILKSIEFPWPIAKIVYQHHEKMNGTGYPEGISGDEILLESRIICVADVVEAMTVPRPYKKGVGLDGALNEIRRNRGILFDPDVVDACLSLFDRGYRFV